MRSFSNFYFLAFSLIFYSILSPNQASSDSGQKIPEPAQCYFSSVAAQNLTEMSECFLPDAMIIDVRREISGIHEIRSWAEREVMGGQYEILGVISESGISVKLLIRFIPPGYSGDGFKAHYTFDFQGGKIKRMNLQYA